MKVTEANLFDLTGVTKTCLHEGGRKVELSLAVCQRCGQVAGAMPGAFEVSHSAIIRSCYGRKAGFVWVLG